MRFWDSSALVPLFVVEPASERVARLLRTDLTVVVWALTRVELMSAIARREREEPDLARRFATARSELLRVCGMWSEVAAIEEVRTHAERIVATHPLRAADALQLGAALIAAAGDPSSLQLVTLDRRLAAAAEREGFPVISPA